MDDPKVQELQTEIAKLEAEKADLTAQLSKLPDLEAKLAQVPEMIETGIKAGLASAAIEQKKQAEHDEAALELKSCMPETFDEFMALNPSVEIIKGAIKGIRSHNPAGAAKGTQQKSNSLYSSGKDLYDKLGVTEEQLAKYNEVK